MTNFVAAFFEDEFQGFGVFGSFGDFRGGGFEDGEEFAGLQAVEAVLALAAVFDKAGLAELREVGRDAALAHGEEFLKLGDGELFAVEQEENADAGGVGEKAERFEDRRHD